MTDVSYVADLAGTSKKGTYFIETYSKGSLTASSLTSVQVLELPGTFTGIYWKRPLLTPGYNFDLSGTAESEATGSLAPGNRFFWGIGLGYGQAGRSNFHSFLLASTTPHGFELGGNIGLTQAALQSTGAQFISVIDQAEARKPIAYPHVLPSLSTFARTCK